MQRFLLVLSIWLPFQLGAEIVTADRMPVTNTLPWSPGVPGGIPFYATSVNVVTDYGAVGDGITDDYSAITNAIKNCALDGAVYFPNGTYLVSKVLLVNRRITLRGQDKTNTVIKSSVNTGGSPDASICFGNDSYGPSTTAPTSGATRGSQDITLTSVAGFSTGQFATIYEYHDPTLIYGHISQATNSPLQWQYLLITNISGNVISIDRPLYWDYTNSALLPKVKNRTFLTTNAGIENLTLYCSGTTGRGIFYYYTANCWATNIIITNCYVKSIVIIDSFRTSIQGCSIINSYSGGANYSIQLIRSTDCLIENNAMDLSGSGPVCQQGASGNVVSYNYLHRADYINSIETNVKYGPFSHGDFANFNLYEGNVCPRLAADNYWGCNRSETWLRNWAKGWMLNSTNGVVPDNQFAANIDSTNYFCNVVGNILAYPDTNGITYLALGWSEETGNMVDVGDTGVNSTITLHGNYDFVNGATQWDGGISDHAIPSSYYLSSKPSWFGALAWPPIGSDIAVCLTSGITNAMLIPAQARFFGVNYTIRLNRLLWR